MKPGVAERGMRPLIGTALYRGLDAGGTHLNCQSEFVETNPAT